MFLKDIQIKIYLVAKLVTFNGDKKGGTKIGGHLFGLLC